MVMTNEEILRSFNQAAKPLSHIKTLAELNGTDDDTIRDILEKQGVAPGRLRRKPRQSGKNTIPARRTILDDLADEEAGLLIRKTEIEEIIPVLRAEMEKISVKLEAVQNARINRAKVYDDGQN